MMSQQILLFVNFENKYLLISIMIKRLGGFSRLRVLEFMFGQRTRSIPARIISAKEEIKMIEYLR
jgi:hypothetical protein